MKQSKIKMTTTKHSIGDLIHHKLFGYRGVIVDIDPCFQLTDEWYDMVARSRPPKNEPWYHVLLHQSTNSTYVAEQNLKPDSSGEKIDHPMVDLFFSEFRDGRYINNEKIN
jgi:heat shock protein HspQ